MVIKMELDMVESRIAPCYGEREPRLTITGGNSRFIETEEYGMLFDATAGYWYNILGMNHPELMEVKQKYGGTAFHIYDENTNPKAEELANKLCELTDKEKVIFGATGSGGCENARKEAVNYHRAKGYDEDDLLFATIKGSYHGSFGEMLKWIDPERNPVMIDAPIYDKKERINELVDDFREKVEKEESLGKKVSGFFYEPIMGVRGSVELTKEYIKDIAEICQENDILLIADDVTTGFGRTGKLFGYEHTGIIPDIICLGKGISAGHYPLSATLLNEKVVNAWDELLEKGEPYKKLHRRGNGIAGTIEGAALGLKVLEILERDNLVSEVARKGEYALEKFKPLEELENVREVRGKGLLMAVDVKDSMLATQIKTKMREKGINAFPEGRMVMFCPAYTITEQEIDNFAEKLEEVI